jgi:hypothetical protein
MNTVSSSTQDLQNSQALLDQLFDEVSSEEAVMAGGSKLGRGGRALQGLRETKVSFGHPADNLIHLTPKLFQSVGADLSEIHKRQMRKDFDFYYMTLTVSMQPGRGAQFTRVECELDFGPKGLSEPIVQSIFPKSEWKEVLNWGGGMKMGLNGNLDWDAGVDMKALPKGLLEKLPGQIKTKIVNKNKLKAFIAIPDYAYKLGRSEIAATGEGNSSTFWRIEKPELKEAQTTQFGIVFKVPKGTTSIDLIGRVVVEPDIPWLVANVRDVFENLSAKLKALLRRREDKRSKAERLLIGDHEKWVIPLPL